MYYNTPSVYIHTEKDINGTWKHAWGTASY